MATAPREAGISLVREIHLGQGVANIVDCNWPRNIRRENCGRNHRLGISLGPLPRNFEGRFKVAGCRREKIGRIVFVPSGVPMEASNSGGIQRIAGLHFDGDTWEQISGRKRTFSVRELDRSMNLHSPDLKYGLSRIGHEVLNPSFASEAILESLMTMILIDLDRLLAQTDPKSSGHERGGLPGKKLALIEERIASVSDQIPTVASLSTLAGLSPRHLLRCYQQETGQTLRDRLQQESALRARRLLRTTDMPIKSISWNLGFRSQGNFTNAFRRAHGETPSQFRSRHR